MIFFPIFLLLLSLSLLALVNFVTIAFPRHLLSLFNLTKQQQTTAQIWLAILLPIVVLLVSRSVAFGLVEHTYDMTGGGYIMEAVTLTFILFVLASGWCGVCFIPYSLFQIVVKKSKKLTATRQIDGLVLLVTLVGFLITGLFGLHIVSTFFDNTEAQRFFVLNAAIKNTCFIDPRKIGCPHNLTELSYIEPAEFATAAQNTQMIYQYYPADNQYTFIVRYNRDRAVIFDPRLVNTDGLDFREVTIQSSFLGVDRIQDPPTFSGPWNNLPKWNK